MSLAIRREHWAQAAGLLADATRFFARHSPVVLAFGAVVSLQRFLAVGGDERFAFAGGLPGELFTAAVRLLFLAWLVRRMFAGTTIPWSAAGERLGHFLQSRTGVVLATAAMLLGLTLVAKVIPEAIAAGLPEAQRPTYLAWELAIKNVTVIPFTMVWLTTVVRHAVGRAPAPAR